MNLNLIMQPPGIFTMPRCSRGSHLFQDSLGIHYKQGIPVCSRVSKGVLLKVFQGVQSCPKFVSQGVRWYFKVFQGSPRWTKVVQGVQRCSKVSKVSLIEGRGSWIPGAVKSHHQMPSIPANYFIFLSTLLYSTNAADWTNYPEADLH